MSSTPPPPLPLLLMFCFVEPQVGNEKEMQLVERLVKRGVCVREVKPLFVLPLVSYRKLGVKHTSDGLKRRKVSSGDRRSVSGNEGGWVRGDRD